MFIRIGLLFCISWLVQLKEPWISFDYGWCRADFNGQALILLIGGIFLLYKSTHEIHAKVNHIEHITDSAEAEKSQKSSFWPTIVQILMIDIIFSLDSILTAVGMTNGLEGALLVMIIAVILSVGIMMLFAVPVGNFVNRNPSLFLRDICTLPLLSLWV